jgi:4-diphosphocytidyl-2-C-methyl-D-erythritol kinase
MLQLTAPAKINLFLEVLGRRSDGYHELVTCMVPLTWADELTFSPSPTLSLTCSDPALPLDENNLVLKAARALQHHTQTSLGAAIHLTKRIPSPAGLGGGSSDAATTLRGLVQLWNLQLSDSELLHLAAQIGSDVPFFLAGSAAWCRGRGEQLTPFNLDVKLSILLICPLVGLSTPAVYQTLQAPPLEVGLQQATSEQAMQAALRMKAPERIASELFNRLQPPAERCLPLLEEIRLLLDDARSQGLCLGSLMSGSGSSSFVVCRDQAETQRLARWINQTWVGGVQTASMGITDTRSGSTERTLRLYITETM